MRKIIIVMLICLAVILLLYFYYYNRWSPLWTLEEPRTFYPVFHHNDDTLRVVMIGDSWAGMHKPYDMPFKSQLEEKTGKPVLFISNGKGGEKTKGIYNLMFVKGYIGTMFVFSHAPDYCVISAGINDAAANLGTRQYCYYYQLILEFLLKNKICPVIIEFPDVDIWKINRMKPIKDLISDYMKSKMTGCGMYNMTDYREALRKMLVEKELTENVLYIPMESWNGQSPELNENIFIEDHIHLNQMGYSLLDSCLALRISEDYKSR